MYVHIILTFNQILFLGYFTWGIQVLNIFSQHLTELITNDTDTNAKIMNLN